MNIAVLNAQIPFCEGGAELLADDLVDALAARGYNPTLITVPFKWYPQQTLVDSIIACKLLDIEEYNGIRIDKVIALRFPLWLVEHHNKALWILHQHRTAYDLWDTEFNDLVHMPDGRRVRNLIVREDNTAISSCERVFTISQNVTDRLYQYNGLESSILYPPPRSMEKFYFEEYGDFFFFPSRITPLKRQELVIEALAFCSADIKVVFAGKADDEKYFERLKARAAELNVEGQITWLGHIGEQEKLDLYAKCLMVLFPSFNEDFGFITPEGMLSSKGVMTLTDSGGALEFVTHDETGCVVQPDARQLGEELDRIWNSRDLAKTYGDNANSKVKSMDISWDNVVGSLLS
ncbi:MAG: glycosyltransferase family 4 protein [Halioglobus sp.]|nr:glycosyltransferase family 4 protein [Halioglobus sp.]